MTTKTIEPADIKAAAEAFDLDAWLDGLAPATVEYEKAHVIGLPKITLQARTEEWTEALKEDGKTDDEIDLEYIAGHIIEPTGFDADKLRRLVEVHPQHLRYLRIACVQLDTEPEVSPHFLRGLSG